MIIETRKLFKQQKISIQSNNLAVSKKTAFKYLEYGISFDDIETKKTVTVEINRDLIAGGIFCLIGGAIASSVGSPLTGAIFWGLCLILIFAGLFIRRRTITIINYSNEPIVLDFNKWNEKKIREFADKIIERTKEYLINKYSRIDKDLPFENQLNSLEFLRTRDLICEDKFQELKNELLGKKGDKKSIGFE
jgi:hypothetical protein